MHLKLFPTKAFLWVTIFVAIWANISAQPQNQVGDQVIAIVGKNIFTTSDLDLWIAELQLASPQYSNIPLENIRKQVFSPMIDHFLLAGWAVQEISPPPLEVVETTTIGRLEELEESIGGEAAMDDLLFSLQIEPDVFRTWLKEKINSELMIRDPLVAYSNLGGRDPLNNRIELATQIQLAHILIPFASRSSEDQAAIMSKALKIRKEIADGLSFQQAVHLYSSDDYTIDNDGILGWFERKDLQKTIWDNAISIPVGTPTEPIHNNAGYQLFVVLDYETQESLEYQKLITEAEDSKLIQLREEVGVQVSEGYKLNRKEKEN
jgi:PPIC-type PPIASE domain